MDLFGDINIGTLYLLLQFLLISGLLTRYLSPLHSRWLCDAQSKIDSMTVIVRSFFENMSKKSKSSGNHLQHSAELEDSGFQVEDSQD